jgi:hypothetical protein
LGKELLINESTSQNADHLQGVIFEGTEVQRWSFMTLYFRFSPQCKSSISDGNSLETVSKIKSNSDGKKLKVVSCVTKYWNREPNSCRETGLQQHISQYE